MPRHFVVKLPPVEVQPPSSQNLTGTYVTLACPKCGKWTYGVAGQKGKKCPVCRCQFALHLTGDSPAFNTPEDARRFVQAQEAQRAGRLDFQTAASMPSLAHSSGSLTPRTVKDTPGAESVDEQFSRWARCFFAQHADCSRIGVPLAEVIASAARAGFACPNALVDQAVVRGVLTRPKPYTLGVAH